MLRSLAILTALISVSVPLFPTAGASSPCNDATMAFVNAFSENNFQFTLGNAKLLVAAVIACGGQPPDPNNLPDPTSMIPPIRAGAERLAADCAASIPSVSSTAPITVTYQVIAAGIDRAASDSGIATGTYSQNANSMSYSVRGTTYGFDSWNQGSPTNPPLAVPGYGIVYIAGVPVPAVYPTGLGKANVGCTDATLGSLCWASGEAIVWIPGHFQMNISSSFKNC